MAKIICRLFAMYLNVHSNTPTAVFFASDQIFSVAFVSQIKPSTLSHDVNIQKGDSKWIFLNNFKHFRVYFVRIVINFLKYSNKLC